MGLIVSLATHLAVRLVLVPTLLLLPIPSIVHASQGTIVKLAMDRAAASAQQAGLRCLTPSTAPLTDLLLEITVQLLMKLNVLYVTLQISTLW